jgi:mannose-6-phosphate isomerase-like protein (cupin superfamily)
MDHIHLRFGRGFRVAMTVGGVQAAEMVIMPGGQEGGPDNRHRGADQWLYVISGKGLAIVEDAEHTLKAGSLIVIKRGERHEIRNLGSNSLKTLNFYSPPAYDAAEEPLPAGKKR